MSLPWFPFHIDDYLGDTMALDTEGHGAYLLLILNYYRTEKPPRNDDRALAAICRMPMNRWLDRRPEIEAFFKIEDGVWRHERVEEEMLRASSKLAQSKARAAHASAVSHAKRGHKPAPSQPGASPELKTISEPAQRQPDASSEPARSQPRASTSTLTLIDSLSTDRDANEESSRTLSVIGTPIDPKFQPDPNHLAVCKIDGATDAQIDAEIKMFVATKLEQGSLSADWDASWSKWWQRWRTHRDKVAAQTAKPARAAPRIEVNSTPDWDNYAKRFARGMGWPRGIGPDPDSEACRCPVDILIKHGMRAKEQAS